MGQQDVAKNNQESRHSIYFCSILRTLYTEKELLHDYLKELGIDSVRGVRFSWSLLWRPWQQMLRKDMRKQQQTTSSSSFLKIDLLGSQNERESNANWCSKTWTLGLFILNSSEKFQFLLPLSLSSSDIESLQHLVVVLELHIVKLYVHRLLDLVAMPLHWLLLNLKRFQCYKLL